MQPSTEAYYRYASADRTITLVSFLNYEAHSLAPTEYAHNVAVPLLSLSSVNDPIIPATSIPLTLASKNPNLVFATTEHGGHLGWFQGVFRPRRWISQPVCEFLRELERADPSPRKHRETRLAQKDDKLPQMGDEMVVVVGSEHVGFMEVAEGVVESGGPAEDDGLIKGL